MQHAASNDPSHAVAFRMERADAAAAARLHYRVHYPWPELLAISAAGALLTLLPDAAPTREFAVRLVVLTGAFAALVVPLAWYAIPTLGAFRRVDRLRRRDQDRLRDTDVRIGLDAVEATQGGGATRAVLSYADLRRWTEDDATILLLPRGAAQPFLAIPKRALTAAAEAWLRDRLRGARVPRA